MLREHVTVKMLALVLGVMAVLILLLFLPSRSLTLDARGSLALDTKGCLQCHGKKDLSKKTSSGLTVSLYVDEKGLDASAHRYTDCTTCHGIQPHQPDAPLTKVTLAAKCGSCHAYQYDVHKNSIHGQALAQGIAEAATCVDCHSANGTPHNVIRVLSYEAPAYRKNIAQTCARCHNDPEITGRYGIVEKVYETYMRSFHGKVMELEPYDLRKLNTATCTNCHGTHDIKKPEDPASRVDRIENLAKTCERCHPGAGKSFAAGFLGHQEASPANMPLVFITERFFLILTTTALALGVALVAMVIVGQLLRAIKRRVRPPEEDS